jgi:hypothetical protein
MSTSDDDTVSLVVAVGAGVVAVDAAVVVVVPAAGVDVAAGVVDAAAAAGVAAAPPSAPCNMAISAAWSICPLPAPAAAAAAPTPAPAPVTAVAPAADGGFVSASFTFLQNSSSFSSDAAFDNK